MQPFPRVVRRPLGFSTHISFAFNALLGCYDRCFTNGKDRGWFWGQHMLNFGKQGDNHPPCGIDTSYLLCMLNTTFSPCVAAPPRLFFSKYICFAFNALSRCYDRCFTNGKDRRWFWGQNMLNFGKQGNNHPPCVTDTPYLLCLLNTTFSPCVAAPAMLCKLHLLCLQCPVGVV